MRIKEQARWQSAAFIPLGAGALWILLSAGHGVAALLVALIPGAVLLATGGSLLLWAGSLKIPQFMALGGLVSAGLAVIATIWLGMADALLLLILGAFTFVVAGRVGLGQESLPDGGPEPAITPSLAAKAALDDALLAYFTTIAHVPTGDAARRVAGEVDSLLDSTTAAAEDPNRFLPQPPALVDVDISPGRWGRHTFERLHFDSHYVPPEGSPGAQRWESYAANHTAHAWMLRHSGAPRPWLVGIHGYRMGWPLLDLALFRPDWLHQTLGFNVLIPVLPLHGPRRAGLLSGDFYMDGDILNLVQAQSQAMWDIRRLIDWLRNTQHAPRIGVLGYSLGGYNAALLASVEAGLDCVIAGIPASDLARLQWRHMPEMPLRYLASLGTDRARVEHAYRRISPLTAPCRVPWAGRFIFAGQVDRLAPPQQVLALWKHWQEPVTCWYPGGHLTFRGRDEVTRFVAKALSSRLHRD